LDDERRLRETLVAAAVVNVNVRIEHRREIHRSYSEARQLADHIVVDLGTDGKAFSSPLAQASDGISDRVTVDASVKEHPAVGVDEQIAGHRDGHICTRGMVGGKA
jgi:hypothetical protein